MTYIPSVHDASVSIGLDQPESRPVKILAARQWPRRHLRISGQSLAKANRAPCVLGDLAGHWMLGTLTFDPPTIAMASKIFDVSPALIRKAIDDIQTTTVAQPAINSVWTEMEYEDRLEFVRTNLAEIWALVEHITD